jgi:formate-dependent phosphoribosylglycinamide formyltransferase (GAR transformylase)
MPVQKEVVVRKTALDEQKKTVVVLRSGEILENWPNIKQELHCNYVMLGNAVIMDILRQKNWIDLFDMVVSTENFDFLNVRKIVEENLPVTCLNNIQFVTANEVMLLACAQLNEVFKSTSIPAEYTDYYLNKDKMKQRIRPEYLPKYIAFYPNAVSLEDIKQKLIERGILFPVFVKPTSGSSSRDVKKCENADELAEFLEKIQSSQEQFEIDEFISGDLYHCDSVIQNGKIVATMIGRYYAPCADFLKGVALGSFPVLESNPLFAKIKAFSDEILDGMPKLENFVTHMELFVQGDRLVFVEVAARPPGGRVCEMYEQTYQLNIIDCAFRTQLGLPLPEKIPTGTYGAWLNTPYQAGMVTHIKNDSFFEAFNSVCIAQWYIKMNQILANPVGLWSVAASIFMTNSNLEQLEDDFDALCRATPTLFTTAQGLAAQVTKQSSLYVPPPPPSPSSHSSPELLTELTAGIINGEVVSNLSTSASV